MDHQFDSQIPPLPFANKPGGTQESYLGPSLGNVADSRLYVLFDQLQMQVFPLQLQTQPLPSPNHGLPNSQALAPPPQPLHAYPQPPQVPPNLQPQPHPAPPHSQVASPAHPPRQQQSQESAASKFKGAPRAIILEFVVFVPLVAHEIALAQKGKPTPAVPKWSKLGHAGLITWMVHLSDYLFDLFKREFIMRVSVNRKHVCTHLRKLELEGNTIQWWCTIHNNCVFGVARNTAVTSEEEWSNFVTEVARNPRNEVKVKITMQDPSVLEKQAAAVRAQDENLALIHAPEQTRLALQCKATQLVMNPKANVDSAEVIQIVGDLTAHIIAKYGGNTENLRIKDPLNSSKASIPIYTNSLWHKAVPILTLDEVAEKAQIHRKGKGGSKAAKSNYATPKFTPAWVTANGIIQPPLVDS
ncbi:hypothetical protein PTTG_26180 [Puccinia triticina 1-1 BBBD Race 1]|uniref:Uncharacterized protein n=1 Tax=Puccinia triticina (isolate 1-1 / race 1 (BBBD)) TaxID=630390 RepID=A0A180GX92_PUCT1|nr:hypothetical protein PTTG_26180 [Puccinia triticina 1-1 BBBD Race 1]